MPEVLQKNYFQVSVETKTRQISAAVGLFIWRAGDFRRNAQSSSSKFNEMETKTL